MGTMESRFSGHRIARIGAPMLLAAVAAVGLLGAKSAEAKNDFANGFEDQLGRIAAYEAVSFGKFVLSGGTHYGARPVLYSPRSHHRSPWHRRYRDRDDRHDRIDRWDDRDDGRRFGRVRGRDEPCDDERTVVYERVQRSYRGGNVFVTRKLKYSDGTRIVTEKQIRH